MTNKFEKKECKNADPMILDMEDLEQIVGGRLESGAQSRDVVCPVCKNSISISVQQLLFEGGIKCPHCELEMKINKK